MISSPRQVQEIPACAELSAFGTAQSGAVRKLDTLAATSDACLHEHFFTMINNMINESYLIALHIVASRQCATRGPAATLEDSSNGDHVETINIEH